MQVKVIELIGESNDNWNDAVKQAVRQASKTIPNITGVEVYNLTAGVSSGRLMEYKANVKVAYSDEGSF
ncbi:dodecin family protein [Dehalobacterium formicoaceticum]|uniref:Dodecin family protein n=1 Tax=Dehalobacterium formicoaceticum TaxID=51515 RepID=A0ABT1Y822_9FIRM|nr:dodecin family protein [Dehalobacterium formicoaceticum]MCR6545831.1 dodecin family protein [Dehalobacterium formicoaceticum]